MRAQPQRIRPPNDFARNRQPTAAEMAATQRPTLEMVCEASGPPAPVLRTAPKRVATVATTTHSRGQPRKWRGTRLATVPVCTGGSVLAAIRLISPVRWDHPVVGGRTRQIGQKGADL